MRKCAEDKRFVELTPISPNLVRAREREELVVHFFTFSERIKTVGEGIELPKWKDRPRDYIYDFVKEANDKASAVHGYSEGLENKFFLMLEFVSKHFPNGFRKSATAKQIPRVRFEALAVGTGVALQENPELINRAVNVSDWIDGNDFRKLTTSDSANVRSKVLGRIDFVRRKLLQK